MLDKDGVTAVLARRGLRLTRQRESVLDAVIGAKGPFTVQQLYDSLRRTFPHIGLTTVYRTVGLLAEAGAVERIHDADHCEAFITATATHVHKVVCTSCGAVSELVDCGCEELVLNAARRTGYRIDDHIIQMSGLCPSCAAREKATSPVKADDQRAALTDQSGNDR